MDKKNFSAGIKIRSENKKEVHNMICKTSYTAMEAKTIQGYNLRCIDGSIHGCSKCVGYCSFQGHPGFLTKELQSQHNCIGKGCHYHSPKPASVRNRKKEDASDAVLQAAIRATAEMDGLRVLRANKDEDGIWIVSFAAIAEYPLDLIEPQISDACGCEVALKQIPCSFDTAVALVMQVM